VKTPILVALVVWLSCAVALAHPGHGHTAPSTWRHYLTEPVHVLVLAAVVVAIAIAWRLLRRTRVMRADQ